MRKEILLRNRKVWISGEERKSCSEKIKKINANLNKISTSGQEKDKNDLINNFIDDQMQNRQESYLKAMTIKNELKNDE
jgi:hypothetical protein